MALVRCEMFSKGCNLVSATYCSGFVAAAAIHEMFQMNQDYWFQARVGVSLVLAMFAYGLIAATLMPKED